MLTKLWSENQKERHHTEDLGLDGRTLEWMLGKWDVNMWIGCIWLRIETSGWLLLAR